MEISADSRLLSHRGRSAGVSSDANPRYWCSVSDFLRTRLVCCSATVWLCATAACRLNPEQQQVITQAAPSQQALCPENRKRPPAGASQILTVASGAGHGEAASIGVARPAYDCRLDFVRYEPSKWEAKWRASAEALEGNVCSTMLQDVRLTEAWMQPMNKSFAADHAAITLPEMQGDEVMRP